MTDGSAAEERQGAFSDNRLAIFKVALGSSDASVYKHVSLSALPNIDEVIASADDTDIKIKNEDIERLKLANTIADAVQEDVRLATEILQNASTLRDVALQYGCARVAEMAQTGVRAKGKGKASARSGGVDVQTKRLALNFRRRIFAEEPTAVLQQMISSQDEGPLSREDGLSIHPSASVRKEVADFLGNRPSFQIRSHSVLSELQAAEPQVRTLIGNTDGGERPPPQAPQLSDEAVESLKRLQLVQALVATPEAIEPLLQLNMSSASRVAAISPRRFVEVVKDRLKEAVGGDDLEAEAMATQIHEHAVYSRRHTDHALVQIHQSVKGTGLIPIDGRSSKSDRMSIFSELVGKSAESQGLVSLDQLFADMDFCECSECQDVTSPTAYYVDLLQYLRNNNLDHPSQWANTGQEGYAGTVLEKLLIRRPDLQHLKLTCENANTALPMIDLANEVMESFVIHLEEYADNWSITKQSIIDAWNIGTEDTNELLASPSHTRKTAYCILKAAKYPLASLPYFQPLDRIRLYLQYLGTTRDQLLDVFRLSEGQWKVKRALLTADTRARYSQLRGQLQDRAYAAEYLGLSPDEYVILTRESIWPIGCAAFTDTGTALTVDQYREHIGVIPAREYWGYAADEEFTARGDSPKLGLAWVKAQFLLRSGLSYVETADLLRTYFVNPMFPSGRDKVILDSIRFSYRFLQLITLGATPARRKQTIAKFLSIMQPWVIAVQAAQLPPTGNDTVKNEAPPAMSDKEILAWVSAWFDCIGKLIVLEAGQGPFLPVRGYLTWRPRLLSSLQPVADDSSRGLAHSSAVGEGQATLPSEPTVIGYLESTGELRDASTDDLLGFVAIDGRVIGADTQPLRKKFPSGDIHLIEIPKDQNSTPLDPDNISKSLVRVDRDSFLVRRVGSDFPYQVVPWTIPGDSCSIESTTIVHLNSKPLDIWEWDRINRFIRLYKKLSPSGWTIPQIDSAIKGLWKVPELEDPDASTPSTPPGGTPGTPPSEDAFSFTTYKDKCCGDNDDEEEGGGDADDCGDGEGTSKSPCDPSNYADISPGFLKELVSVFKLQQLTGLELEKLLCFWSDIGSFGDKSLYSRLFLTHDLKAMDDVFQPNDDGNILSTRPLIKDHIPVISTALRIKISLFDAVLTAAGATQDSIITVPLLTKLYRYPLLASILSVKLDVLLGGLDLFLDPFHSASRTLGVYRLWGRMLDAGFSVKQLSYVILDKDDNLRSIQPSKVLILRTAKSLMDGLGAIALAQQDLNPEQLAVLTAADVKTRAAALYSAGVVEDITGLIEGTKQYTTNAPTGLTVDQSKVSSKIVYKDLTISSPVRRAKLSVTGCLTEAEAEVAEALFPGNNDWSAALARLQRQAVNKVKALSDLFADNLDEAVALLAQGDVPATPPASETELGDPGTAPAKRAFFMRYYLPMLRNYLSTNLVVSTMAGIAGLSQEMSRLLLSDVLSVGPPASTKKALQVLLDLQSKASMPSDQAWNGFLVAPSTDSYVFCGFGQTKPDPLVLDGTSIPFDTQGEDPSDIWWTAPVPLTGGKLYALEVKGQTVPGGLQWKTARGDAVPVPASALVPETSVSDVKDVFKQLSKASIVAQGFKLDISEVEYFQNHASDFDGLNLNKITFGAWKRLLAYAEFRDTLVKRELSLIDLFKWAAARNTATLDEISNTVSTVTTWDAAQVRLLLDPKAFDFGNPKDFLNEVALLKLAKVFELMSNVGVSDLPLLISWTDLKLDFKPTWKLAKAIRTTIRARYTASDYEQAIKPTHDQLRKNQRDALMAYLLVQTPIRKWGATDADGLFEFFLLDVQMGACLQTSRTKQAISSVQLFVQRCMLGLEERYGVANDSLDAARWQWMSKQTVWAANRKVFLYPENWLIPSLRDNKTPIYDEMENEMLQKDISPPKVLESFKDYATRLDQISHLRAAGLYVEPKEGDTYVLHCIAHTLGAPYLFFYRTYASLAAEWTPWLPVPLDIPSYIQPYTRNLTGGEFPTTSDESLTGSYVAPVCWNGRVLLFIGQLISKTVPNDTAIDQPFSNFTKPDSSATAKTIAPLECWEFKLAWSEYRDGKWSQKQIAAEACLTIPVAAGSLSPVDGFQIIPAIVNDDSGSYVSLEIWRDQKVFVGMYQFHGSIVVKYTPYPNPQPPEQWMATNFHLVYGRSSVPIASSLQKGADGKTMIYINKAPYVKYTTEDPDGRVFYDLTNSDPFYHQFSSNLLSVVSQSTEIDPILNVFRKLQTVQTGPAFGTGVEEVGADNISYPTYSELTKPYSNYNWELGFHAPMHISTALLSSQQFDSALDMIHHVFNPYADGPDERRVWQWPPFKDASSKRVLETILNRLRPRQYDGRVTAWRDHPFRPFVVARGRTVAYMKWTVMTYIQVLIAYGDFYFRRRTLEDIPLAIQCYVLASHMYGPKGEKIPKRGRKIAQTYFSLLDKWDAFSNASVQLELAFPFSNQTPFIWGVTADGGKNLIDSDAKQKKYELALANVFGFATSSYFCLPTNPNLVNLRTTIDQRLFNIRNCLDIDGRPMPVSLWEPPLDPGQLIQAVASGLSISSALNDLNATLPSYRFQWLMGKALELCAELKGQESAFLAIKEKRDGEALQRLRSTHEIRIHGLTMDMKKQLLVEADKQLQALANSQESPKYRHSFYSSLSGAGQPTLSGTQTFKPFDLAIEPPTADGDLHINSTEKNEADNADSAQFWNQLASGHEIVAGILHSVPSFNIHMTPMGCGTEVAWGMPNIASSVQAQARLVQIIASDFSHKSSKAGRKDTKIKTYQDRIHQMNLAGFEFDHINAQLTSQKVRLAIANQDIATQQQVIDNTREADEFLRNKYTNDELYSYLETSTRTLMYQTYTLAYDLAKKAELAYRFERRVPEQQLNFVSFGYFDQGRDGLQSGQQLYLALKRLEAAYQTDRGHDYELTKSVSLRLLNPYALLQLRETGTCQIDLPEVVFDMDFPGHFFRRIKSVAVTVPCVAGPYSAVNATLQLLSHRYRWNPVASGGKDYVEKMEGTLDARFRTGQVPIDAVCLSSPAAGQAGDAGVFELQLRDERYLPFEGAGAVSSWRLSMPSAFRQFDYGSISDVVMTVRYTSCEGGASLRKAAAESIADYISTIEGYSQSQGLLTLFDIRSDFAAEWARLASAGTTPARLVFRRLLTRLPAFTLGRDLTSVRVTDVSLLTTVPVDMAGLALDFAYEPPASEDDEGANDTPFDSGPIKVGKNVSMFRISDSDAQLGDWGLKVKLRPGASISSGSRMWLIVRYVLKKSG